MEFILVSGLGTLVLLAAQMFDYLRDGSQQPVTGYVPPMSAEAPPQVSANPSADATMEYDRAA